METKPNRPFASQSSSFRLYEDNYEEVLRICHESGRKPAEEMRDLIDEALRARRATEDTSAITRALEELTAQSAAQNQALSRNLRHYYGLLLEMLAASYGARRLLWGYVAVPRLHESGCNPQQIEAQFESEARAWNAERDKTADMLEQAIHSLPPPE